MIKRKKFSKIPLQANYYPMTSAIYIEDDDIRLTLLSAQPLGVASLREGQIEVSTLVSTTTKLMFCSHNKIISQLCLFIDINVTHY